MSAMNATTRLITNARIVTTDEVVLGTVTVQDGRFADLQTGCTRSAQAEDWCGDYLIPGLVELHTDNLEKHLEPRPGVRWPAMSALLVHDAQVAAAGITTVLDAMGVGDFDERSVRDRRRFSRSRPAHRSACPWRDRPGPTCRLRARARSHVCAGSIGSAGAARDLARRQANRLKASG